MRPIQIESWALEIIDCVNSKSPKEDSRVELKSEWPEPQKAARQIAGHANAARGEPILWLIGVDEDKGVKGAAHEELASWFVSIQAEFDGIAPSMIDLNIPVSGKTVVALYFETDRAPYVIKNPAFGTEKGGPISYETPWREGTRTRTARRSDLLKVLVSVIKLPEIEVLSGELILSLHQQVNWCWNLGFETYITPQIGYRCVLPFHNCEAFFEIPGLLEKTSFESVRLIPPYNRAKFSSSSGFLTQEPDSLTIVHTQDEAIIEGPGRLDISGKKITEQRNIDLKKSIIKIGIKIKPSHSDSTIEIGANLHWKPPDQGFIGKWIWILEAVT